MLRCRLILLSLAALLAMAVLPVRAEITVLQVADYSASRASLGRALRYGASLAIAEANRQGGLHGEKFKLVALDDRYEVAETLRLLKEGIDKHDPVAVVNLLGTANTGAVLQSGLLDAAQIALIGPYTGADHLRVPLNPRVFHVRASYAEEVDRIVQHFANSGIRRIGIVHEADPFGESIHTAFVASLARRGLQVAGRGVSPRGSVDVSGAVAAVMAADPQGVIIGTAGSPTGVAIKAIHAAGLRVPAVGLSVNDATQIVKTAGVEAARGFGMVAVMPDPNACALPICQELRALHAALGDATETLSPNTMEGFIAARLMLRAAASVRGALTRQKLRDALDAMGPTDLSGFLIRYSPTHHNGSSYSDIGVIGAGGHMMY
ncbi:ABC transporter substrate-binding protein [Denitromonas iodatirespirans]|uniref:ABC transporter substrate-binding protein n=1 Tax=Denitromonas iodatirespirans TaxID=2795389 RepID=A0A944HAQ6_DENI1|nr:ABC transporter substrate-binding protein [Denitromonas iodatirespirans]MBT0959621.1 ABC transporter substrate-binding protein [Denitromonas iodatirespirans]